MTEEFERELYVFRCISLQEMVLKLIDPFSDRENVAVLTLIIAKIIATQADPKGALEDVIDSIRKKVGEENEV